MSEVVSLKIDAAPLQKLVEVIKDYQVLTGKDQSQALRKAGREVGFAMFEETRKQPPRPIEGSITAGARIRGWRTNTLSRSYLKGFAAALGTLGGNKSGYFRLINANGVVTAQPIVLGKKRRIVLAGRKNFRKRGSLLASASELIDPKSIPADAVRLNATALAVVRGYYIRERAARGGYMAAQWLTYKYVKVGKGAERKSVLAKNSQPIGEVVIETDNDGNAESILFAGRVPGTAAIAEKYGILNKAISTGADNYRRDMYDYATKRLANAVDKLKSAPGGVFNK